jgi:hypothetical protein
MSGFSRASKPGAPCRVIHLKSLTVHPAFWFDSREPVLSRWDSSQIFLDFLPLAVGDRQLPERDWNGFAFALPLVWSALWQQTEES